MRRWKHTVRLPRRLELTEVLYFVFCNPKKRAMSVSVCMCVCACVLRYIIFKSAVRTGQVHAGSCSLPRVSVDDGSFDFESRARVFVTYTVKQTTNMCSTQNTSVPPPKKNCETLWFAVYSYVYDRTFLLRIGMSTQSTFYTMILSYCTSPYPLRENAYPVSTTNEHPTCVEHRENRSST